MKWLTKREEASLSDIGKYPGARTTKENLENGIVIIDKPPGPTSHQISAWVKEILNVKKAGHAGTLDPSVTGVLVVALNNATKLMPILLSSKKEYVGIVHLHSDVSKTEIREAFKKFIGKIRQFPPKKSAVARRMRTREIYDLKVLEIDGRDVLIQVECEAGTYIRRIADDVGKILGGAHLQELRRIKSGIIKEEESITMQKLMQLKEKAVLPMELSLRKGVIVSDNAILNIVNGSPLYLPGILRLTDDIKEGDWAGMFSLRGELIAIGKSQLDSNELLKKNKGIAIKTDRVLLKL